MSISWETISKFNPSKALMYSKLLTVFFSLAEGSLHYFWWFSWPPVLTCSWALPSETIHAVHKIAYIHEALIRKSRSWKSDSFFSSGLMPGNFRSPFSFRNQESHFSLHPWPTPIQIIVCLCKKRPDGEYESRPAQIAFTLDSRTCTTSSIPRCWYWRTIYLRLWEGSAGESGIPWALEPWCEKRRRKLRQWRAQAKR